jgi:predicted RNase H-like HicB family nuclease
LKFLITVFQDEDGRYIAECPAIPGCVSQGQTKMEAERNINEAIKESLAGRAEKGLPLTVPTRQIEVEVDGGNPLIMTRINHPRREFM